MSAGGVTPNPMLPDSTTATGDATGGDGEDDASAALLLETMTASDLESYIDGIARKTLAYAGEAPTNLHQVTTYKVMAKDTSPLVKCMWLASSFGLWLIQELVICAVMHAVERPSCVKNGQCMPGTYCGGKGAAAEEGWHTCAYCGETHWFFDNNTHHFESIRGDLIRFEEHHQLPVNFVDNYTTNGVACA